MNDFYTRQKVKVKEKFIQDSKHYSQGYPKRGATGILTGEGVLNGEWTINWDYHNEEQHQKGWLIKEYMIEPLVGDWDE